MWARRSEMLDPRNLIWFLDFRNDVQTPLRIETVDDWTCKYNSRCTEPSCSSSRPVQYLHLSYKHKSANAKWRTVCCQRQFEINSAKRKFFLCLIPKYKPEIPTVLVLVKDSEWGSEHFETMRYAPLIFFVYHGKISPVGQGLIIFEDSIRNTTLNRTPLDELSACRRALYLTPLTADERPCSGEIWTHNLSRRAAADARLSVGL